MNSDLEGLIFDELKAYCNSGGHGGFLPAVKQLANVAALPGIVQVGHHPGIHECASSSTPVPNFPICLQAPGSAYQWMKAA